MMCVAFILGGVAGAVLGLATVLLTGAGWGTGIAVYVLTGLAVPLLMSGIGLLRTALATRPRRDDPMENAGPGGDTERAPSLAPAAFSTRR